MMMMMNCFCGIVDRRKAFSLISSRDHCQLTDERRLALFPAGTTVRDPHHRESPTRREQG